MFNKYLIALACAAAAACTAHAAEVKVLGMIDTGLRYQHASTGTGTSTNTFDMADGLLDANRIILTGGEALRPGTEAGFWLEASYASDTGAMKTAGTLFDRAGYVWISDRDLGRLSAGVGGFMRSGATLLTYGLTARRISPFGTGWGDLGLAMYDRPFRGFGLSNMIQYDTPAFAGVSGHFQYSFDAGSEKGAVEGKSSANRYASAAMTYDGGKLNLVLMADMMNESSLHGSRKNAVSVLLGGNYSLDPVTLFGFATWFNGEDSIMPLPGLSECTPLMGRDDITGTTFSAGMRAPLLSGEFNLYAARMSADADDADATGAHVTRMALVAGWRYELSKQTTFYTAAGWYRDRTNFTNGAAAFKNPQVQQVFAGIHHNF